MTFYSLHILIVLLLQHAMIVSITYLYGLALEGYYYPSIYSFVCEVVFSFQA